MGAKYLLDLADVCRRTGYPVIEVGGARGQTGNQWQTRARGSGGYAEGHPNHVIVHHTASGPAADGWGDVNYCCFVNAVRPVGNLYLSRLGEVYVMAAGAANTNGVGKDPCGITPDNQMNSQAIAIEAGNNGVGEVWSPAQLDCYVKLVKALCDAYGIGNGQIHAHAEWAKGRKIDPAGPPEYATGAATWDMNHFRSDVAGVPGGSTPPPIDPTPPPTNWWDPLMQRLPLLQQGSRGAPVKRMQHLLAAAGFMDPANVKNYDGVFGSGTANAVNKFKQAAGGQPDGICDPWTWGALMHTVDGIPTIRKGQSGDDVERMQHLLAANGFMNEANTANYDGAWGNGTETAKINFDKANGLTPSPPTDCGQKSWTKLLGG